MKKLGTSADNIIVYNHPEGHSHRPDLDAEVISKVTIGDCPFVVETITLNRIIGVDHLVETSADDIIIRYKRGNRSNYSRMVLNRTAEPTNKVTIILCKCGAEDGELDGKYALVTLYEGQAGNPEPYGRNDTPENREFWTNHALVPTEDEMIQIEANKINFDSIKNYDFELTNLGVLIATYWFNDGYVFQNGVTFEITDVDDYITDINEADEVYDLTVDEAREYLVSHGYCK